MNQHIKYLSVGVLALSFVCSGFAGRSSTNSNHVNFDFSKISVDYAEKDSGNSTSSATSSQASKSKSRSKSANKRSSTNGDIERSGRQPRRTK